MEQRRKKKLQATVTMLIVFGSSNAENIPLNIARSNFIYHFDSKKYTIASTVVFKRVNKFPWQQQQDLFVFRILKIKHTNKTNWMTGV